MKQFPDFCRVCRSFCGQEYNGNWLCCAMHPYGPDDSQSCPDHEVRPTIKALQRLMELDLSAMSSVQQWMNGVIESFQRAMPAVQDAYEAMNAAIAQASTTIEMEMGVSLQQISTHFHKFPQNLVVEKLMELYNLEPAIAQIHVRRFVEEYPHLHFLTLFTCLQDGRVVLRYGRLRPGRGFGPLKRR